jgi:hypothetical protein
MSTRRRLGAEEVYDTNAVDVLSAVRSAHPDGLADGKITARIRATVDLDGVSAVLSKLRDGGLRGKAVVRLQD